MNLFFMLNSCIVFLGYWSGSYSKSSDYFPFSDDNVLIFDGSYLRLFGMELLKSCEAKRLESSGKAYRKGTINMGLWYSKDSCIALTAFADADHAGCQDTKKSTSGSMQLLGDRLVSWSFKRQKSTAISSIEAEYITLIMNQEEIQQAASEEAWVPKADIVKLSTTNIRLDPIMTQKEETY
ncbi:hypothetical protein Tco_0446888 [Tanacetum coccineum]